MNAIPWRVRLQLAVKRAIDVAGAGVALVLLSPLLGIIAAAIKIEDRRSPLFFNDWVVGRGASRFRMLKFRTMIPHEINYDNRPEVHAGSTLVTRVGRVLRRLKLDELPQFVNVFRGDMSLVGPRPMDPVRFSKISDFQRQRLLMRPGLTGWAQVNGNIHWTWNERMEMDLWYIARWSLALDLRILTSTVPTILFGERPVLKAVGRINDHEYRIPWPGYGRFQGDRKHSAQFAKFG
jgi:lipopolysaccharide/colanic/teichoic acid biosynthesis glycosyltransferase